MKIIAEQCYKQRQSWCYDRVVRYTAGDHTLKVSIERNAYDDQSHAKVSRWDGAEWKYVHDKPIAQCHCSKISYVQEGVRPDDFLKDAEDLLGVAMDIIY